MSLNMPPPYPETTLAVIRQEAIRGWELVKCIPPPQEGVPPAVTVGVPVPPVKVKPSRREAVVRFLPITTEVILPPLTVQFGVPAPIIDKSLFCQRILSEYVPGIT